MKKVNSDFNFIDMEHNVMNFWEEEKCFDKLREMEKNSSFWMDQ